jgi:hypothetical protein
MPAQQLSPVSQDPAAPVAAPPVQAAPAVPSAAVAHVPF